MKPLLCCILWLYALVVPTCHGFAPSPLARSQSTALAAHQEQRRSFLAGALTAGSSLLVPPLPAGAFDGSVAVIGAGGRTGMEVTQALAKEGISVKTMTRSSKDPFQIIKLPTEIKSKIVHYPNPVDVISKQSLEEALSEDIKAVVYCASASKQGGTAFEVDDEGVANAAQVAAKIKAKFILISALAIDRPDSKSYQITNTLGGSFNGIMDAKLNGERKLKATMKDYIILRPGVLLNGKTKHGALDLEVNQGDMIGGGLSRDELANAVVGALTSGRKSITVELYRRSTHTKLQPKFPEYSGNEQVSSTYPGLFQNVKSD